MLAVLAVESDAERLFHALTEQRQGREGGALLQPGQRLAGV